MKDNLSNILSNSFMFIQFFIKLFVFICKIFVTLKTIAFLLKAHVSHIRLHHVSRFLDNTFKGILN